MAAGARLDTATVRAQTAEGVAAQNGHARCAALLAGAREAREARERLEREAKAAASRKVVVVACACALASLWAGRVLLHRAQRIR